jgi:hypothetical protein
MDNATFFHHVFADGTLGRELQGYFLRNRLEPEHEGLEFDMFSVLLRAGPALSQEIAVHWYLLGNGKATIGGCIGIATGFLMPSKAALFLRSYRKGRQALLFHQLDFGSMLHLDLGYIRSTFNIQTL